MHSTNLDIINVAPDMNGQNILLIGNQSNEYMIRWIESVVKLILLFYSPWNNNRSQKSH